MAVSIFCFVSMQMQAQMRSIEVQYGRSNLLHNFDTYLRFKPIDSYRLALGWEQIGRSGFSLSADFKQIGASTGYNQKYNISYIGILPSYFSTYKSFKMKAGCYLSYQVSKIDFIKPFDTGIYLSPSYQILTVDGVNCALSMGLMYSAFPIFNPPMPGFHLKHNNMQNGSFFIGLIFHVMDN
jgi:hypothetical protein